MMAVAHSATQPPIQPEPRPTSFSKAPTAPRPARLPKENSTIISGTDQSSRKTTQATRKLPPPFVATMRGKRQMLPVPTAIPRVARISPQRLPNCSRALMLPGLERPEPCAQIRPGEGGRALLQQPLHEPGRELAGAEPGVAHDPLVQRDGGLDPLDDEEVERPLDARDRLLAVAAVGDQLGHQRVVVRRHDVVLVDVGVDADPRPARRVEGLDRSRRRHERARILGVDPALDGVPARLEAAVDLAAARRRRSRSASSTRSRPVTISVTGCSTWMRVFISMK